MHPLDQRAERADGATTRAELGCVPDIDRLAVSQRADHVHTKQIRLAEGTRDVLQRATPLTAPVLVGMANSPLLPADQVAEALRR